MHQTDVRPPSLNECSYRSHLSLLTIITCLGIYQVTCNATASNVKQFVVLRFDCGAANSPVKRGWIRVTHNTVYTRERGYGWLRAGSSSFDRTEVFIPRWLRESIAQKPQLDDMLRDGVFDKQDISFRADVPDGQYWVVVSIGDEGATRRNMSVYANGITIAENVTTQTSWGGFSTTRTFRKRIEVNNGKLELMFRHNGDGNSVLGIEVISFVPYPIWFANGRWHCSSVDENLRRGLEAMNKRAWQSARDSFARISEPLLRAIAFATLADILDVPEDKAHAFVERAIGLAEQLMRTTAPDSHDGILARELKRVCSNYLRARQFMRMLAYGHATKHTGFTFSRRLRMAEDWCQQITEYDPLFDRACLNIGRIHYWLWREGGSASE
ncbi:MAG TPA: hypothetical protein EYP10_11080, partial [Armatimonadetes bacterium]|nr:hypothetical protein [Armatimonadota bacterium]